ncbi:YhaI family protein [Halobacillus salinarum]|uniref:YhaI family protein n=1 Tax=Halobacillus salinarum TaxID=2932257 RepID=A0ABY4EGA5_9BACI|nr:DUF1878 family protein [Halobacillus salinarum]UOQ43510.1 YhaI family protein [Halobacillus salinarum]
MERKISCETCQFHVQLLLKTGELKGYSFTKMIIEQNLDRQEYEDTLLLLDELNAIYEEDKELGLVDHSGLLLHFAGMLNYKLSVTPALIALYEERIYPELAAKLLQLSRP